MFGRKKKEGANLKAEGGLSHEKDIVRVCVCAVCTGWAGMAG